MANENQEVELTVEAIDEARAWVEENKPKALRDAEIYARLDLAKEALYFIVDKCMEDVEAAREMWLDAFERAAEKSEQRPDTW